MRSKANLCAEHERNRCTMTYAKWRVITAQANFLLSDVEKQESEKALLKEVVGGLNVLEVADNNKTLTNNNNSLEQCVVIDDNSTGDCNLSQDVGHPLPPGEKANKKRKVMEKKGTISCGSKGSNTYQTLRVYLSGGKSNKHPLVENEWRFYDGNIICSLCPNRIVKMRDI